MILAYDSWQGGFAYYLAVCLLHNQDSCMKGAGYDACELASVIENTSIVSIAEKHGLTECIEPELVAYVPDGIYYAAIQQIRKEDSLKTGEVPADSMVFFLNEYIMAWKQLFPSIVDTGDGVVLMFNLFDTVYNILSTQHKPFWSYNVKDILMRFFDKYPAWAKIVNEEISSVNTKRLEKDLIDFYIDDYDPIGVLL